MNKRFRVCILKDHESEDYNKIKSLFYMLQFTCKLQDSCQFRLAIFFQQKLPTLVSDQYLPEHRWAVIKRENQNIGGGGVYLERMVGEKQIIYIRHLLHGIMQYIMVIWQGKELMLRA